jgi:CHAT domain-containing protein
MRRRIENWLRNPRVQGTGDVVLTVLLALSSVAPVLDGDPSWGKPRALGVAPRLVWSASARQAARAFPSSRILEGSDGTARQFLADAGDYEVVHFCGHATWNERQPRFAALDGADDAFGDGR